MPDGLTDALPRSLGTRTRFLRETQPRSAGRYVLYSLSGNLRSTENQALDAAVTLGNALGVPVLAVFELREDYPFASDRHHRFILEGARVALAGIEARGIATAAYVHRAGHRRAALPALARDAAAVVVDDMPTRPYREARAALLTATAGDDAPPVLAVDGACLVPMVQVGMAYDRAYKFRKATKALRLSGLETIFSEVAPDVSAYDGGLAVAPLDLAAADLGELTAACRIDHSVPPVPAFPGGENAALARWTAFRDERLKDYADRRNDALQDGAVSHLSPYLRHGMIAATRIARDAAAMPGKGPEKFLDELLIWREMSWSHAFHEPDHDRYESLPGWARESLERRTLDARPALYSWESLARGRTADAFWNAAQAGYLRRGYLHNNVRMTWGKALPAWTESPQEAAARLIDLNNRYGLDGGDPNSFSGLFWCLGAFDRPFEPEQPIFGVVRPRSTEIHARRLDTAAFRAFQVRRPEADQPHVAVVGAGPAGLICARTLADQGIRVTVFDKGRRVGGRTATRRLTDTARADHGAPWFQAADARLAPLLESWLDMGLIETRADAPEAAPTYVVRPESRRLAEHLAKDLDVRSGVTITALTASQSGWHLEGAGDAAGPYDRVVLAVPAPQAAELLAPVPRLAETATQAVYDPCITAMVRFPSPVAGTANLLKDKPPLALAVRESAKPGRSADEDIWVLHADAAWSATHIEADPGDSAQKLVAALKAAVPEAAPAPLEVSGHRWRYAQVRQPIAADCLFSAQSGLGACGDWCPGGGIEGALLSGLAMAGRLFAAEPDIRARGAPQGTL